jgi:UDP:flavonoid glycosyltransferase YjiC (YdhE family)
MALHQHAVDAIRNRTDAAWERETMRITVMTVGSRGDIQPLLALALGLRAAGHAVRFATHAAFAPFVRDHGIDDIAAMTNPFTGMNAGVGAAGAGPAAIPADDRPFKVRLELAFRGWAREGLAASADADAVIYSQLCVVGEYVAERRGIPGFVVLFGPLSPTGAFPSMFVRRPLPLGGAYNRLTHQLERQLSWRGMRGMLNRVRAAELGLGPLPAWRPPDTRRPTLYIYSRHLVPRPPDWSDNLHVTGFLFLDGPADWQPPPELERFLANGPPPVFVGLGSIGNSSPARVTKLLLQGLARAGQRTIVNPGNVDLRDAELPPETLVIGATRYDWLFPRTAGVICHGGPGTLSYALRAGVPTLAVPFFGEQFFWGARVAAVGAGPPAIPHDRVTPERVAAAVRAMANDRRMRERAAALGRAIRAENGVANAVAAVQAHLPAVAQAEVGL